MSALAQVHMAKKKKEDPYDLCACYEPEEPTPEEFIDPGDREPTLADTAIYIIDQIYKHHTPPGCRSLILFDLFILSNSILGRTQKG